MKKYSWAIKSFLAGFIPAAVLIVIGMSELLDKDDKAYDPGAYAAGIIPGVASFGIPAGLAVLLVVAVIRFVVKRITAAKSA